VSPRPIGPSTATPVSLLLPCIYLYSTPARIPKPGEHDSQESTPQMPCNPARFVREGYKHQCGTRNMLSLYSSRLHCFKALLTAVGFPSWESFPLLLLLRALRTGRRVSVLPLTFSVALKFTPPVSPGLRVYFPSLLQPTIPTSLSSLWWNYVALVDQEHPMKSHRSQKLIWSPDPGGTLVLLLLRPQ